MGQEEEIGIESVYIPEEVKKAVILLHGFGSNSRDMLGLVKYFSLQFKGVAFYCPDAPFIVSGYPEGRQWFSIENLEEIKFSSPESLEDILKQLSPKIKEASEYVSLIIDKIREKHNISARDIVIGGFSQGGMVAIYNGLSRIDEVGGIMGFSTLYVGPFSKGVHSKPRVFLSYGLEDEVLPHHGFISTREALEGLGIRVKVQAAKGVGHSIDYSTLLSARDFLEETFLEEE